MRYRGKRVIALLAAISMVFSVAGCAGKEKSKDTKENQQTETAKEEAASPSPTQIENMEAAGDGNNRSDVPLEIGFSSFDKVFNPFAKLSENNITAVNLTQLRLFVFDREGAVIYNGMEGESRYYNGENYTYTAPSSLKVKYDEKKNQTVYTIKLREDLTFSDGEPLTADDVIFSMYAFCDTSYEGSEMIGDVDIKGLAAYRRKNDAADKIAGIRKKGDYEVQVITEGYHRDTVQALNIPVCPLHIYGDSSNFSIGRNQFGFTRGDISSLTKRKELAIGAGAYNFIKFESGIIYYEANEKYYQGCPSTAFLQLKEMKESSAGEILTALSEGEFDIASMPRGKGNETVQEILASNSNGKLNGGTTSTRLTDGSYYTFIGINAETVCVDRRPDSTRSKNLRKALGTMIASGRYDIVSNYLQADKVIDYPNADTSWVVPQNGDEEYKSAYSTDRNGELIYTSDMTLEERQSAAAKAAIGLLKAAGYRFEKKKVVDTPEHIGRKFTVVIPRDAENYQEMYLLLNEAKTVFEKIGLKLKLITDYNQKKLDDLLKKGTQQIWCSSAETKVDGELTEMYHSGPGSQKSSGSKNYFHISDSDLDDYIEELDSVTNMKKSVQYYSQCFDIIMDWAVVVPVYQQRDVTVFSSSRINMETIAPDITPYYGWIDEIQNVEMK